MAYLELIHIHKTFGVRPGTMPSDTPHLQRAAGTVAVTDFDLQVERGEFVSFLGPSGCGKTTTLRMIAGLELPTSGTVRINDVDVTRKPPNQRNVGMVFQSYALFPNMTVARNIGFGMKVAHRPKDEIEARVKEMLALIRMPDLGDRYPYQLSGGQQQRVALTRALAIKPQVLLLDEPLSALDAKIRVELRGEIRRIQQQLGITTIYVTHDQEEALSLSDRVVVMNGGAIEQIGGPFEIYNYPRTTFVAGFVGTLNQLHCTAEDPAAGKLAYDGQIFAAGSPVTAAKGQPVLAMLRPEELRFGKVAGENHLKGVVERVTFLGSIVRMHIRLGMSTVTLDALNERRLTLPKVGETQTVSFPAHAVWVLPEP